MGLAEGGQPGGEATNDNPGRGQQRGIADETHLLRCGDTGQFRPHRCRAADGLQCDQRQGQGCHDHHQPLQRVSQADRPESAQPGVNQHNGGPDQDGAGGGQIEYLRKGVTRALELRRDIEHKTEQDDDRHRTGEAPACRAGHTLTDKVSQGEQVPGPTRSLYRLGQ